MVEGLNQHSALMDDFLNVKNGFFFNTGKKKFKTSANEKVGTGRALAELLEVDNSGIDSIGCTQLFSIT